MSDGDFGWLGEIDQIRSENRAAQETLGKLHEWLWHNVVAIDVFPRALPEDVAALLWSLRASIGNAEQKAASAQDRYRDRALALLSGGWTLTWEQYYLLVAMNMQPDFGVSARSIGPSEFDDYEVFCMLCYEDERRRAYINPLEEPRNSNRVKMRFGKPPEELEAKALRPEQLQFFKRYLPEVLARFR